MRWYMNSGQFKRATAEDENPCNLIGAANINLTLPITEDNVKEFEEMFCKGFGSPFFFFALGAEGNECSFSGEQAPIVIISGVEEQTDAD